MVILNEEGQELNQEGLDYNIGYLTKSKDGVFVYHLFNEQQLAQRRIDKLHLQLEETNNIAVDFADEIITAEQYAPTKAQRQQIRDEIKQLEEKLK